MVKKPFVSVFSITKESTMDYSKRLRQEKRQELADRVVAAVSGDDHPSDEAESLETEK